MGALVGVTATMLLLLAAAGSAIAQGNAHSATISGVVQDGNGLPLDGAAITLVNEDTNQRWDLTAAADGRFNAGGLPPGPYRLLHGVVAAGERVVLAVNTPTEVIFRIDVAGLAETLTVVAPVTDPRRTSPTSLVLQPEISASPLNGRDFRALALLTPMAASDRTPQQGSAETSGWSFAGQRARSNNMQVDGLDNNDTAVGGVRAVFSQEAVREFQVLSSAYSAEFGRASGGIVNVVTRSGGAQLGGEAFAYLRHDRLNAREYFERFDPAGRAVNRPQARYRQAQFGASAGGPLRADRTFFFAAFEQLEMRANNFVNIDDREVVSVGSQAFGTAVDILRRAGFEVETGNVPYIVSSSQLFARLDHQLTGQQLSTRMNWATARNENSEPWGGLVARSRGGMLESRDAVLAASHTVSRWRTVVNDLRAQVAHRDQNVLALDPRCAGPCDSDFEGGPTLEVTGVASVGRHRFSPQPRETIRYQIADTFSWQHGNQFWKFGADYNYVDHPSGSLPLHFGGRYIFAALPAVPGLVPQPLTAIQALALGIPAAYVQGYGDPSSSYAVQDLSLFAQNEWRIASDLTLKLGVRYQAQMLPDIRYDVAGLEPYVFPSMHDIAPRAAVAWNPGGDPRWSMHGAYGLYHDIHLTTLPGVTDVVDGSAGGVRTLVARPPASVVAWNQPDRRLAEAAAGAFPSLKITVSPEFEAPYAHHVSAGVRREWLRRLVFTADATYVRGFAQVGTLDYNPIVPALGPERRPQDRVREDGVPIAGTSASLLQYTNFGETWYRGLSLAVASAPNSRYVFRASYTLSKAEDTSTDYQNAFLPENTGAGRDPADPTGLPRGFDPRLEKGPSVQDQRHRLVASAAAPLPAGFHLSSITTIGSARPFNILAGRDLNGDGNGGAYPPDRARTNPADGSSSIGRNTGRLPMHASTDVRVSRRFQAGAYRVDALVEVFNLFNRTNFSEINNVFGVGVYPSAPDPTFGQFEKAGPPRQLQVALRLAF